MKNEIIFNRDESIRAQRDYCKRNGMPLFIPSSGRCCCGMDIFDKGGYTVKEAGSRLITGCPCCHRSFCD